MATSTNHSKSRLAAQAIAAYVEEQSWQIQQLESAIVDSGEAVWVEGEVVTDWLNSWGTDTEKPTPCA